MCGLLYKREVGILFGTALAGIKNSWSNEAQTIMVFVLTTIEERTK